MTIDAIVERILQQRGVTDTSSRETFLHPSYEAHTHDPFLLASMETAVTRLVRAHKAGEKVVIYGDYDIDGLTATTLLLDALGSFGFEVEAYIPDRFEEGYGLNAQALTTIKQTHKADVVVTVDCGSVSFKEAEHAAAIGLDLIITDHHTVRETLPPAVAVLNPKRNDNQYPFIDLAGVGVAFKLVQALQSSVPGIPVGQEKWLLDLVALGTVCDVVALQGENRALVYWGLKVMQQTRRPGLRALMHISRTDPSALQASDLGFRLGPRLNAAGRLKHARHSLDLLRSTTMDEARTHAELLDRLNSERRLLQHRIVEEASVMAATDEHPVLILAQEGWSQGVVGIVAAKLMEMYKKPTFVMEVTGEITKGSARAFGDFSAVEAIRAAEDFMLSGGGHAAAGGVTIRSQDLDRFRETVNQHYRSLNLDAQTQARQLEPQGEIALDSFQVMTRELLDKLAGLEPFGNSNPEPLFEFSQLSVVSQKLVGQQQNHLKLELADQEGSTISAIAFNRAELAPVHLPRIIARIAPTTYHPRGVDLQIQTLPTES